MDMTETIAPKSDQMDYEDLIGSERTFTIAGVRKGPSADQPVQIDLEGFDRPWRPAKTVRRILVHAWGTDATKYVGKRVTLFGDPTVKWAGKPVGGIRVKALSGIDKSLTVNLTVTRGKREPFTVDPLPDAPQQRSDGLTDERIAECVDTELLRDWWRLHPGKRDLINARVAELQNAEQVDIETGEIPMDDGPMFPEAS